MLNLLRKAKWLPWYREVFKAPLAPYHRFLLPATEYRIPVHDDNLVRVCL